MGMMSQSEKVRFSRRRQGSRGTDNRGEIRVVCGHNEDNSEVKEVRAYGSGRVMMRLRWTTISEV
jgi:hypothetical protein